MRAGNSVQVEPVRVKTKLNRLHPYPAMVADELALRIAREHVPPGARVLDPFCGSGRLLAACDHADFRVGIDVNPLACLLTRAKLSNPDLSVLEHLIAELPRARHSTKAMNVCAGSERTVSWFPDDVLLEFGRIVGWINRLAIGEAETLVLAACLSAVVRECSFARQAGWKLHRIPKEERDVFTADPWDRLVRRLNYFVKDSTEPQRHSRFKILNADVKESALTRFAPFDCVVTSPPYGDSKTTVQYGAASALSLSVICKIDMLSAMQATGGQIDSLCLGGKYRDQEIESTRKYWAGGRNNPARRRVHNFCVDYSRACTNIAGKIRGGGRAVFVVGRRHVGGFKFKLDRYTIDLFESAGFRLLNAETRKIKNKRFPAVINRFARAEIIGKNNIINTMKEEVILSFEKAEV